MSCNINKCVQTKIRQHKKNNLHIISVCDRIGLFGLCAYMALMTPFVQTRLVDYFTRILEERTGTTISYRTGGIPPDRVIVLNDVFVRDCRQDTLVFCERLVMKVDSVSFVKRRFTITEAAFEKAKFNLWIERRQDGGESLTNVEQLINSFSSSKVDTVPQTSSGGT